MVYKNKQEKLDKELENHILDFSFNPEIKKLSDIIYFIWVDPDRTKTQFTFKKTGKVRKQLTGRARSREDCYKIAKKYFPEITFNQINNIADTLCNRIFDYKGARISILHRWYCPDVRKYVHVSGFQFRNRYSLFEQHKIIEEILDKHGLNI